MHENYMKMWESVACAHAMILSADFTAGIIDTL